MKQLFLLMLANLIGTSVIAGLWNPAINGIYSPAVGNWNVAANWEGGLPDFDDTAMFNVPDAAECWVTDTRDVGTIVMGDGGSVSPLNNVLRIACGGDLTVVGTSSWAALGYNCDAGSMIVETGGSLTVDAHFWVGMNPGAVGRLIINGGDVIVSDAFTLGRNTDALGYAEINSGLLQARYLYSGGFNGDSVLNIKLGQFVLTGGEDTDRDRINSLVAAGDIVAFGGASTVNVEKIDGNWTAAAASDPLDRVPAMDAYVTAGEVNLSWNNLDPIAPATDVWVDVWYSDVAVGIWHKVLSKISNETSVSVTAPGPGQYRWRIDTYRHGDPAVASYGDDQDFQVDKGIMMAFKVPTDCIFIGPSDLDGNFEINLADFAILSSGWQNAYGFENLLEMAEAWLRVCPTNASDCYPDPI